MTSKKKLQFIRDTYEFYFNRSKPFRDTELTEQEKEAFDSIEKDLEQKELLESELKLEKDKVKYIMKQLKKQDKILEIIFKKNVDIELLKLSTNWLDYYTRVKHRTGKNTELIEEFDLLKEWLDNDK